MNEPQSLAEVIGLRFGQAFTWESPDGTTITWSIDIAKQIIGDRPTDLKFNVTPDGVLQVLRSNNRVMELDSNYAMTTDLSVPLIAVISPIEKVEGKIVLIIIDGWHRIVKALVTQHRQPLKMHVLTDEEAEQCRIERMV